ncbi:hypothetical protein V6S67_07225 [Arthrobacter sp. Soc17.1.1.1]|uniref:hypothetical protein n=1 Tax=Arthrobacter sp. Soc17.1.1.1 TaxID=3121277 RepID=UPI002FE4CB95
MAEGPDDQQQNVINLVKDNALHLGDLWIEYFALTGIESYPAVADYVYGRGDLPQMERDLLDLALTEIVARNSRERLHGLFRNREEDTDKYNDEDRATEENL